MKHVHFVVDSVYVKRFIEVNNEIDSDSFYVFLGNEAKYLDKKQVFFLSSSAGKNIIGKIINRIKITIQLYNILRKADRVYFHYLTEFFSSLIKYLPKRIISYWLLWGADVYDRLSNFEMYDENTLKFYTTKKNKKTKKEILCDKKVIRKINKIGTIIDGDYELLSNEFGIKDNKIEFFYVNPLKFDNFVSNSIKHKNINILLGNSADPANNHISVLKSLQRLKNVTVYCPLSYGESDYAENVIKQGKDLLGENFIPLTEFMDQNKYLELLDSIDVGIMNHYRQQALGNIFALLTLGKTMYINSRSPVFKFLESKGIVVHKTEEIQFNMKLELDEDNIKNINKEIVFDINSEIKSIEYIKNLYK